MNYVIIIPKIVIPSITISWPLWVWVIICYAVVNFVFWQYMVSRYRTEMVLNGVPHLFLVRLNPFAWLFAWLIYLMS